MKPTGCATRARESFQKLCDVLYRRSCPQHVHMLSSLSVTQAFSAAVPTRISKRRTVRVSSTLPEKSDEAGVPGRRSGKDYSTRGPSLSDASAANAAESEPCVGVTRIGSGVVDAPNSLEHGRRGRTDDLLRQPDGSGPLVQFVSASGVESSGSRRSLRPVKSVAFCISCARLLCVRSHRRLAIAQNSTRERQS